jgi:hypothetical protein
VVKSPLLPLLVAAIVAVARPVAASEIATDPPPSTPASPTPPRARSLAVRFGMATTQHADRDRMIMLWGLGAGLELADRVQAIAEYEWWILHGTQPSDAHGRGHAARVGIHLMLREKTFGEAGRIYCGIEPAIGAGFVYDSELGAGVLPHAIAGLRLGYELWTSEPSPSKMFGAHLLFRALVTRGDVGFAFGLGMEWGR